MSIRYRSVRERRMAPSLSEPAYLKPNKTPLLLPTIKKGRYQFYDELSVSPDFVNISKT